MTEEDKVEIARLRERLDNFQTATVEYRRLLCEKIAELHEGQKEIFKILSGLPCKEQSAWYASMNRQMLFMWGVITLIGAVLVKILLKV